MTTPCLLERSTLLPQSPETVFDFFSKAENLEILTPPWLNFSIKTPLPIEMTSGTLIEYQLKLYGIPMYWQTEISAWEPPYRFVDRQIKGPYRLWVHTHTFEAVDGGTRMTDEVNYKVPLGPLGSIANLIFVRKMLSPYLTIARR